MFEDQGWPIHGPKSILVTMFNIITTIEQYNSLIYLLASLSVCLSDHVLK